MDDVEYMPRAISIAVRLISSHNSCNIKTLKNFLYVMPDPRCVRDVLTAAVLKICTTSVDTTCWLLQNPEPLRPEIDVRELISQYLSETLHDYGVIQDQHYTFEQDGAFVIRTTQYQQLMSLSPLLSDKVALETVCALMTD